jgi:hypothetical protein
MQVSNSGEELLRDSRSGAAVLRISLQDTTPWTNNRTREWL